MSDEVEQLTGNMEVPQKSASTDLREKLLALNGPSTHAWIQNRRQNIRSWRTFVDTSKFGFPVNAAQVSLRIVKNVDHFQSNYIFVFLGLVLYCLLTSPLLLIAVGAAAGACYTVKLKNAQQQFRVFGHQLTLAQQYGIVVVCSFPLLYLAGAGSAVFWIIGASFFFVLLHATFFAIETVNTGEEAFSLQTV